MRACGTDDDGPARRHATRHDQLVIWASLCEQRWSTSGGRRGAVWARKGIKGADDDAAVRFGLAAGRGQELSGRREWTDRPAAPQLCSLVAESAGAIRPFGCGVPDRTGRPLYLLDRSGHFGQVSGFLWDEPESMPGGGGGAGSDRGGSGKSAADAPLGPRTIEHVQNTEGPARCAGQPPG